MRPSRITSVFIVRTVTANPKANVPVLGYRAFYFYCAEANCMHEYALVHPTKWPQLLTALFPIP